MRGTPSGAMLNLYFVRFFGKVEKMKIAFRGEKYEQ